MRFDPDHAITQRLIESRCATSAGKRALVKLLQSFMSDDMARQRLCELAEAVHEALAQGAVADGLWQSTSVVAAYANWRAALADREWGLLCRLAVGLMRHPCVAPQSRPAIQIATPCATTKTVH